MADSPASGDPVILDARPTRDRLVTAANEVFRRRGYHDAGLKEIVRAAEATVGSLYHFFPDGKVGLTEAVIDETSVAYRQLFEVIAGAAVGPADAVGDFFDGAALVLAETDYIEACPIGTIAREIASTDDRLRLASHRAFTSWIEAASELFRDAGIHGEAALDLAHAVVGGIEGGFLLARAARSPDPLIRAGRIHRRNVEAAVEASAPWAG